MKQRSGTRLWLALIAAAVSLLAIFAWLQFAWIGRVSRAEHERMAAHLRAAVLRFSRDFDSQVSRAVIGLVMRRGPFAAANLDQLAEFDARWLEASGERRLVRAVYLTDGPELLRLNPAAGRLEHVDWPPELLTIHARLAAQPVPQPGLMRLAPSLMDEGVPAVVAARFTGAVGRGFVAAGWNIVELNLDDIQQRLFPELARLYLAPTGELNCEVRVVNRAQPSRVIYASDPSLAAEFFADPDAEAGLFDMLGRGPAILPATEDTLYSPVPRGPWTVLVKNRSGSLEQLVAQTRRRNLAVSFGILVLMAASLAALLLSNCRAQKLAALQMEFVAGVSHELRTPLAVICSAADNLADGLVSNIGQVTRYGSVIRGEGRRLSRMVEQILGFAGIQRGRAKYELESVDLVEVIQAAVKACDAEVQQSGCDVNVRLDPGLPLVTADAVALAHCFRNLIDNALTHGRSGAFVSVEAHAGGGAVEVRVADRGPGIPKSDLPHLFKPFFRGGSGEPSRGFGLGLALVKHVVAAHGGRVNVTSTPGQGACFVVTIPAGPTPAVSENPNAGQANPAH